MYLVSVIFLCQSAHLDFHEQKLNFVMQLFIVEIKVTDKI